jgi:hypothetical protein
MADFPTLSYDALLAVCGRVLATAAHVEADPAQVR